MFRATVWFRPVSDDAKFEVANVASLRVDGVEVQPKDLDLKKAKTLTLNYHEHQFGDTPTRAGCAVINVPDIAFIEMVED